MMDHWLALERICNLLEDDNIPVSTYFSDRTRKWLPKPVQRWIAPAGIEYTTFHNYFPGDKTENDINIYAYKDKIIVLKGDIDKYTKYNVTTVTKIDRLPTHDHQMRSKTPVTEYEYQEPSQISHIYTYFGSIKQELYPPVEKLYERFDAESNEIVLRWFFRIGVFTYWIKMEVDPKP